LSDRLDPRPAAAIASAKGPFRCLRRLFVSRMFHGGSELGTDDLDLGIGITVILLALPGLFVSLLLFEKYGSLIRFLRGDGAFDPFEATIPDEYFFIVLSMAITGIATLWKCTVIFPDRRDFANLVHLPISLRHIFFANFAAVAALASLYAIVVNAASMVLFPLVVVGSQGSLAVFMRFFVGHALTVIAAGVFAFCLVFALTGILLALFPYGISRRISTFARFLVIVFLLALVASSLSIPGFLSNGVARTQRVLGALPSVWFLGLSQKFWGRAADPFFSHMAFRAVAALAATPVIATFAYIAGFRRSFQKIPESADLPLIPKLGNLRSGTLGRTLYRAIFKTPTQQAFGRFILQTLWRSEIHQQVLLFSLAIGLVASGGMLAGVPIHFQPGSHRFYQTNVSPLSADALSIPLILAFCVIVGMRFCFEIPLNLQANWIFRFWIDPAVVETRPTARRLLLVFSLSWLAPLTFFSTLYLWGLFIAVLHTSVLIVCSILIVEIAILRLGKIPFTCSYPPFQSHSPLIVLAYFSAAIILATYLPEYEMQVAATPAATPLLFVPFALILLGLYHYRKNMLPMDKELIFEEPQNNRI
jgi:hypothetical protein